MSNAALVRRILSTPPGLRSALISPWIIAPSRLYLTASMSDRSYSSVPAIASTSFWKIMIPKPFRKSSNSKPVPKKPKSKEWNPATFFIIIFLLIGSMSIQMIALRNSFAAFSRRADARISLLREIIERVQNGEKVDVEGLLGTGNKQREEEWEEVLREIEEEDQIWEKSRKPKPNHGKNIEKGVSSSTPTQNTVKITEESASKTPRGFY